MKKPIHHSACAKSKPKIRSMRHVMIEVLKDITDAQRKNGASKRTREKMEQILADLISKAN